MSRDILLNHIDADPEQPRKHFDQATLDELAQSMAANGLAVPILVRPVGERYIIVHGERRWRAAQQLGWQSITAEVRELSAEEAHWLALIENIQRADLSPIEEAQAYQAHLATGITQEELGKRIGKSRTHIATMLRFLKLPEAIQQAVDTRVLSEGHAKQLLRVDDIDIQWWLYHLIREAKLPVKRTAELVEVVLTRPSFHTIVTTSDRNMVRAYEFAVWSAAVTRGKDEELSRAKEVTYSDNPTLEELFWACRTCAHWERVGAEIALRAEREIGKLAPEIQAGWDSALEGFIKTTILIRDLQSVMTPEELEAWAQAEIRMDRQTLHDFTAFDDRFPGTRITPRMWEYITSPAHECVT